MGEKINNKDSIYYWAWKNNIPVFCPAITDGAIGDILFTNTYKNDLVVDIAQDIKAMNKLAMTAEKSGVIILGGGVPKHHILNANIWRNGADFGVFINTGLFEDGSDSGAKIEEAYTWGKIKLTADFTKIYC
jgi:deoxyhypusine synthase